MPGKDQDRFWLRNSRHLGFGREPSLEQLMRMADLVRSLAQVSQRELLFEHKVVNGVHSANVTITGLSSSLQPVESAISKEHAFALACYKLLKAICSNHSVLSPKILLQTVAYAKSMEEVAVRMLPAFDIFMRTIGDEKKGKQQMGLKLAQLNADKSVSQYIEEERRCTEEPLSQTSLEVSSSKEDDLVSTTACSSKKMNKKSKHASSSSESEPEKKTSIVKTELMSSESIDRAARPYRADCTSRRKIKIEAQSPPPSPLSEKTPEIPTAAMSTMTEVASAAASNEEDSFKSTKKRKKKKPLSHHSEDEFEQKPLIKKVKAEPFSPLPEFGDEAATSDQAISKEKGKEDAAAISTNPLSSFTYSSAEHTHEEEHALFATAAASQERWANYVRILHEKILPAKIASELPADIVSRVSCWMDGAHPRAYAVQLQRRAVKKCKKDDNRDPFVEFFEAAKKSFKNIFPDSFFELLLSLENWDSISAVLENHGRKLVIDFRDNQMEKLRIGRARLLCHYDKLFLTPEIAAIVNSIAADPGTFESTKPRHHPVELNEGKFPFDDESRWRVVLTHGVISAWWREGEAAEWEKEHAEEMKQFSTLIHDHFLNNVQGQAEYEQKLEVLKLITDAAKMVLDNCGVHFRITGSTTSLLSAFNSDLNLCLVHPTDALDIEFARRIYRELVEALGSRFEVTSMSLANPHNLSFTARLSDSSPPIPAVISHNIHCVHFSQLMVLYERVDDRLAPLCLFIKHWLLQTTFEGPIKSINSYLMTSLLIHFLQCGVSPPVLPCLHELYPDKLANDKILELDPVAPFDPPLPARENDQSLSSLLLGFFDYFSTFRFDEFYIAIRTGRPIRLSNGKLSLPPRHCEIVIVDPFDHCLKITCVVGVVPLQRKMMEAAKEIRSSFNLSMVQV